MPDERPVAVVTGGGQGIGRGIAAWLLPRDWRVLIAERDEEAGREAESELAARGEVRYHPTDVADEASVKAMVESALDRWGRLDALINNAGIADPETGPVEQLDLTEWDRRLRTNLTGAFLTTKHAAPALRRSQGSIVNIASTRALQSEPDCEAYAASKGGLLALTYALAVSLGPEIRVNAISPGWIDVQQWKKASRRGPPRLTATDHEQHPAGRVGRPEDVASLVEWLIGKDAGFVTGQNFVADGGMSRRMMYEE